MKKRPNKQKGFTLVELIVAAGIISLLTAIVISQLDTSRAKGRDTKKISELKSLQTALELYRSDASDYPQQIGTEPARNNGTGLTTMSTALNGVVAAGYLSAIPVPPKGSTLQSGDIYYYQTQDAPGIAPSCNNKLLGETPYIIYFYTEQPHNLPKLKINGSDQDNGYCLAL